jgi:hypothetical protein
MMFRKLDIECEWWKRNWVSTIFEKIGEIPRGKLTVRILKVTPPSPRARRARKGASKK